MTVETRRDLRAAIAAFLFGSLLCLIGHTLLSCDAPKKPAEVVKIADR